MAKVKSSEIPHYELLYIISNKYTEDEAKKVQEHVNQIITKHKGEATYSEEWGKKKLAYKIEGFNHGYYNLVEFDITGEDANTLNDELRLSSEVLRHMMVRTKKRTLEEIQKDKEESEKIFRESVGGKKIVKEEKEKKDKIPKKEEMIKKEAKKKKEVDLKDLDEKLDKILETDDLI